MKKLIFTIFATWFVLVNAHSQSTDSIRIFCTATAVKDSLEPLYIIDGQSVHKSVICMINPKQIKSIDVLKDKGEQATQQSRAGSVVIKTKKGYSETLISLSDLGRKYVADLVQPVLFSIDGVFFNGNPAECRIDESQVSSVDTETIDNSSLQPAVTVIRIVSRSNSNTKPGQVMIR